MLVACPFCNRRYDDLHCSTNCPHKGLGSYCVVCDTFFCICPEGTTNERSNKYVKEDQSDKQATEF